MPDRVFMIFPLLDVVDEDGCRIGRVVAPEIGKARRQCVGPRLKETKREGHFSCGAYAWRDTELRIHLRLRDLLPWILCVA